MRAILVDEPGGPEHLRLGEYPTPEPGPGEIRVRVRATALNRADTLQRRGLYPPPPGASPILGLELAGEVETLGDGVTRWREGDRVFALLSGGGYAENAVLPAGMAMPIPASMTFEQAAAVPEVFLTAFQALHWIAELQAGEHALIHAGASGVGTAAIQLARAAGAHPHVTASAPKHDACRALGAETTIDYKTENFAERTLEATDGHGADVILDFIGAPYLASNLEALARDGRMVLLALMGGARVEEVDLRILFRKRGQVTASTLRSRSLDYKLRLTRAFAEAHLADFERGVLRPVIDSVMDWADAADAHRRMEANRNVGKIVLRVT